jgi:hypothetical protein
MEQQVISGCLLAAFLGFFVWLLQKRLTDPIVQFKDAVERLEKAVDRLTTKQDAESKQRSDLEAKFSALQAAHDTRVGMRISCAACGREEDQ